MLCVWQVGPNARAAGESALKSWLGARNNGGDYVSHRILRPGWHITSMEHLNACIHVTHHRSVLRIEFLFA